MAGTRRALVERMRALDAEGVNCRGFFVLQGVVTPDAKRITKAVLFPIGADLGRCGRWRSGRRRSCVRW